MRIFPALVALSLVACSGNEPGTAGPITFPEAGAGDADAPAEADARLEAGLADSAQDAPESITVWAPNATAVTCEGDFGGIAQALPMSGADGIWSVPITTQPGDSYRFRIETPGGTRDRLDPRALARDSTATRSVVAPRSYVWPSEEAGFTRPAIQDLVVYEMHAGTYHAPLGAPASLADAAQRLDHLRDLGITAIELLPIHEFPGEHSWGYNPELLYVVESVYGGAEALKLFVQEAHARGIAVILDVVYNHLSPDNPLCGFDDGEVAACNGIYFYEDEYPDTPWGPRFDYDEPNVRAYLLDNANLWLDTFHVDGFRWDSTGNIRATNHGQGDPIPAGEQFLRESNDVLHARSPGMVSIAEDLSGDPLLTEATGVGGYGFDAQWHGAFHSRVVAELMGAGQGGSNVGSVRDALLDFASAPPFARIIYTETHDTTGKLNGHVRLPQQLVPSDPEGTEARRLSALALALTLTAPGIPMLLQGQELLEPGSFHDDAPIDWARATDHAGFVRLVGDLCRLRRNLDGVSAGLRAEGIEVHHVNDGADVLAFHRYDEGGPGDDVVVLVNLSPAAYPTYRIGVPDAGTWRVRLDTSWEEYGLGYSSGSGAESYVSEATPYDGMPANVLLSVAPLAAIVMSR